MEIGKAVPRNRQYVNFIFTPSNKRAMNIMKAPTSVGPRAFTFFFQCFDFWGFPFGGIMYVE